MAARGRLVVVVVKGEDKLEKVEDVSRQAGDDKSFLSVPRLLCCVCVNGKTIRGQHIQSSKGGFFCSHMSQS